MIASGLLAARSTGWAVRGLYALQTATPTPGVGVDELTEYWPIVIRGGWFLAGFLVVVAVGWFLLDPAIARLVRRRNRNNPTIDEAVSRYVRVLVLFAGLFVGAGVAGYGRFVGNSAIVIAAGTLAVGVAGQTVIGSLVSGIVLVADPEFNVGDYIEWEDGEGTIRSITLRVTRVLTPDGERITVPNTVLTGQAITRPFGERRYRVVDHVGIEYRADVGEAVDYLEATAESLSEIAEAPSPKAYVDEFDADVVVIQVHYWVEDPRSADLLAVRSAFARAAKRRLEDADIAISPTSQLELDGRIEVANADERD